MCGASIARPSQELQRYHRYCLPYLNKAYQERVQAIERLVVSSSSSSAQKSASGVTGSAPILNDGINLSEHPEERQEYLESRVQKKKDDLKDNGSPIPHSEQDAVGFGTAPDSVSHSSLSSFSLDANGHKPCTSDQENAAEDSFQCIMHGPARDQEAVPPKKGRRRARCREKLTGSRVALA